MNCCRSRPATTRRRPSSGIDADIGRAMPPARDVADAAIGLRHELSEMQRLSDWIDRRVVALALTHAGAYAVRLCVEEVSRTGWALALLKTVVRSLVSPLPLWQTKQFSSALEEDCIRNF